MAPAPESSENATICENASEGARPTDKHIVPVSTDSDSRGTYAQLQTGPGRPVKAAGTYTPSTTPGQNLAFAVPKRMKYDRMRGQGNHGIVGEERRSERGWKEWSPWPTSAVADRPANLSPHMA